MCDGRREEVDFCVLSFADRHETANRQLDSCEFIARFGDYLQTETTISRVLAAGANASHQISYPLLIVEDPDPYLLHLCEIGWNSSTTLQPGPCRCKVRMSARITTK